MKSPAASSDQTPLKIIQDQSVAPEPITKPTPTSSPVATPPAKPILKTMAEPKSKKPTSVLFILPIVTVLLGVATGFLANQAVPATTQVSTQATEERIAQEGVKVGDQLGIPDEGQFSDPAEGVVEVGGIDGEGSHRLLRPGGPNRNVYLTSSVIDLNLLVGHRVKVWGDTYAAQKAGWLMDVGHAEVLELNAPAPFEQADEASQTTE